MKTAQEILFLQNRVAYLQDEVAYKALFFHYHPLLYKFCYIVLKNREDAEDVVSEVMMKIWLMGKELNYVEDLTLYLYKASRNACYDLQRKKKRYIQTTPYENAAQELPTGLHTDQSIIVAELEKHLHAAINQLPTQCQLVFRLIKEQGFTYKQVTAVLEVSQNTVETHIRIALKKIREALKGYLETEK